MVPVHEVSRASSRLYKYRRYTQAYLNRDRDYFRDEAHPDLEIEFLPLFKAVGGGST